MPDILGRLFDAALGAGLSACIFLLACGWLRCVAIVAMFEVWLVLVRVVATRDLTEKSEGKTPGSTWGNPSDIEAGLARETCESCREHDHLALLPHELDLVDKEAQRADFAQTDCASDLGAGNDLESTAGTGPATSVRGEHGHGVLLACVDLPAKPAAYPCGRMTIDRFDAESTPSERSAGHQRMRTCFRSALSENNEYLEAYSEKAPVVSAAAPRPKAGDGFPLDEWLRQSSAFILAQPTVRARQAACAATRQSFTAAQGAKAEFIEHGLRRMLVLGSQRQGTVADEDHLDEAKTLEWQSRMHRYSLSLSVLVRAKQKTLPDMAIINLVGCLVEPSPLGPGPADPAATKAPFPWRRTATEASTEASTAASDTTSAAREDGSEAASEAPEEAEGDAALEDPTTQAMVNISNGEPGNRLCAGPAATPENGDAALARARERQEAFVAALSARIETWLRPPARASQPHAKLGSRWFLPSWGHAELGSR